MKDLLDTEAKRAWIDGMKDGRSNKPIKLGACSSYIQAMYMDGYMEGQEVVEKLKVVKRGRKKGGRRSA